MERSKTQKEFLLTSVRDYHLSFGSTPSHPGSLLGVVFWFSALLCSLSNGRIKTKQCKIIISRDYLVLVSAVGESWQGRKSLYIYIYLFIYIYIYMTFWMRYEVCILFTGGVWCLSFRQSFSLEDLCCIMSCSQDFIYILVGGFLRRRFPCLRSMSGVMCCSMAYFTIGCQSH